MFIVSLFDLVGLLSYLFGPFTTANVDLCCVGAKDVLNIYQSNSYQGLFHVLGGVISPLDGIYPDILRFKELKERINNQQIKEVILALNPTVEGDTTVLYLQDMLSGLGVNIYKLAQGIPIGSDVSTIDQVTINKAFEETRIMTQEKIIHFEEDVNRLLSILPNDLKSYLKSHPLLNDLNEIVMDIGHPPSIRFEDEHERLTDFSDVTDADLTHVTAQIGEFNSDNRAGIEKTLHRVQNSKSTRKSSWVVYPVGRAVIGAIQLIEDISEGKNLLILGPPGVGKTTKLREAARFLSTDNNRRVMIIDTSNEIGGEGDIPHPGIGYARRMQVLSPEIQDKVMIEAVENHTPQVIVVDEIGTELDKAARTIAERGVQLIGAAHGDDFVNVMKSHFV